MPHFAAFDQGLYCLQIFLLRDARHKWVNWFSIETVIKISQVCMEVWNWKSLKTKIYRQSTLVILSSLISNNRLSRSENLVPVLTQRSTNRQQNIVEKWNCSLGAISPLFHNIFNISFNLGFKLKIHSVEGGCWINCFPQFRKSHYENMPIQIYWKFYHQKMKIFI